MSESLQGAKVFVLEDEGIVALWLTGLLEEVGCEVIGPAARVGEALSLIERVRPDAAILDINIAGEMAFGVADKLSELNVPFAFATGYGTAGLTERHCTRPVLQKPYSKEALRLVLEHMLAHRATNSNVLRIAGEQ